MSALKRFENDERGATAILFAVILTTLAIISAVVANIGLAFVEKRQYQSAIDLAAIYFVEVDAPDEAGLRKFLIERGLDPAGGEINLTTGLYSADPRKSVSNRFHAQSSGWNAVRVSARFPVDRRVFAPGLAENENFLSVEAVATMRETADIWVGSRLLRLEDGLTGELLYALLGYDGRIEVMDYDGLVDVDIELLTMLGILRTELDVEVLTYNEVLDSRIALGDIIASLNTMTDGGLRGLLSNVSLGTRNREVRLGDAIDLGRAGDSMMDHGLPAGNFVVSAGELLFVAAALANGDRQIEADIEVLDSLVDLSLDIGDPGGMTSWNFGQQSGSSISTSQTELELEVLDGIDLLDIHLKLEVASAEASISDVVCNQRKEVEEVVVSVRTSPVELVLDPPLLRKISISLSDGETQTLRFDADDIENGTIKTARSGLDISLNRYPLLYRPLISAVDDLLVGLGLHLSEADVRVTSASCTRAYLVD